MPTVCQEHFNSPWQKTTIRTSSRIHYPLSTTVSFRKSLPHTLRQATYTKAALTECFFEKKKKESSQQSKLIELYTLNICGLLYVNDASITLLLKSSIDQFIIVPMNNTCTYILINQTPPFYNQTTNQVCFPERALGKNLNGEGPLFPHGWRGIAAEEKHMHAKVINNPRQDVISAK